MNQVNYEDGQSHEEKNVDESSEGVGRCHTKEPENELIPRESSKALQFQSHKKPVFRALVPHPEIAFEIPVKLIIGSFETLRLYS